MKHVRFVVLALIKYIDLETEFTYVFASIVLFSLEYRYRIYFGIISAYICCVSIHDKINIRLRSLRCTLFKVFFHIVIYELFEIIVLRDSFCTYYNFVLLILNFDLNPDRRRIGRTLVKYTGV